MNVGPVQVQLNTNNYSNYTEIIDCHFENVTSTSSSVLYAYNSRIRISNTYGNTQRKIMNSYSRNSGMIRLSNGAILTGGNLIFDSNRADKNGAIISSDNSKIILNNTLIQNNTAAGKGMLYLEN